MNYTEINHRIVHLATALNPVVITVHVPSAVGLTYSSIYPQSIIVACKSHSQWWFSETALLL
jgi:hypothetical protein